MSQKIILTKLSILALKSVISFILILSLALSCSVRAQNPAPFFHNNTENSKNPLLLSADELIYNHDINTVSAQGNVQIEYDGNKVTAQSVTYNQKTGRIIAQGNVEIIQKNGNKIYSNQIDMTEDFGEGFINSLRIETANNIHFAAANAQRSLHQITIFNNATYTACQPCYDKPNRETLWKIKAKKIIWNNVIKTIRFEDAHFEILGIPVIKFPVFELPDPAEKRVSGLLTPHFFYANHLGFGIKNSYFWNLSPHYDFTLSGTFYTKQGLLTEGEWRQHFKTGIYSIHFAHIYQTNPHNFENNTVDAQNTNRYMMATKGDFRINSRWTYGWDIFAQSDPHFSRAYKIEAYSNPVQTSQLYLSGLTGKNYFDTRFYHFQIQDSMFNNPFHENHSQQAWVLPRIDYFLTPEEPVYAGELTFNSNMQSIYRSHAAGFNDTDWQNSPLNITQLSGVAGKSFRLTGELEWKKRFNTQNGFIIIPTLALRADTIAINAHENYNAHTFNSSSTKFNVASSAAIRSMATIGLELRYPFLITSEISTHILEPTVQVFIRNNEHHVGQFPNEDAQSFVFDSTTLFQRDKFSGYDRVEGGTRANIGLRYSGNLSKNWSFYSLVGQSFHLAGKNSFAEQDPINTGSYSGIETARSDYVAMFGVNHDNGFSVESRGRFNKITGKIRRNEIEASQKWSNFWIATQYTYIQNQPDYEYKQDRQEISFQTGVKLSNNWSINNNVSYDLVSRKFVKQGINLSYIDECFGITFGYQQITNPGEKAPLKNFNFSLSLRTIADFGQKIKLSL